MLFLAELTTHLHTMDVLSPIHNSATGCVFRPLTNAELSLAGNLGGSSFLSHVSHVSYSSPPIATTPAHLHSLTLNGHGFGPTVNSLHKCEATRPLTAQSFSSTSFDKHSLPTSKQLTDAALCFVIAENGLRVPPSELFRDQRTIVLFIRHF